MRINVELLAKYFPEGLINEAYSAMRQNILEDDKTALIDFYDKLDNSSRPQDHENLHRLTTSLIDQKFVRENLDIPQSEWLEASTKTPMQLLLETALVDKKIDSRSDLTPSI